MAERRLSGRSASPGLAIGPLLVIDRIAAGTERQGGGTPLEEAAILRAAIEAAARDLQALAEAASEDGADILAFQIEMLADPTLIDEALKEISTGKTALEVWNRALDEQIKDFEASEDDYFRARASDFRDLKDRVGRKLMGIVETPPDLAEQTILLDVDLTPSRFMALDHAKLGGIALSSGSATSHVAMLARARGIPMLVGLDHAADEGIDAEALAIVDADEGLLILAPERETEDAYEEKLAATAEQARLAAGSRSRPAGTRDGQTIDVLVNIDDPQAIDDETLKAADGVGLMRTEFLFLGRPGLPTEDEQVEAYAALADRLAGKPVIIRTLDIGGDKPLPTLPQTRENNPFLGLRGIRLCFVEENLFRVQVRALLRARIGRVIKVMLPMITAQAEIDRARHLFETCLAELEAEGIPAEMPPIGIMIETPAAAIAIDHLDAAFYSIGSNDLIQYVMAAARDADGPVADLLDPAHPAISRLIGQVAAHGDAAGREVSLCGDMASDPRFLSLILEAGLRKISVAPAALGRVKHAIGDLDLSSPSHGPA